MNDSHRVVVVIQEPNKNPYELWVLGALFLSGLLAIIGLAPKPNSMIQTLPYISTFIWNLQLVTGSLVALIGIYWRQPTAGRTFQIAGHLWTGSGAFIYACVLFYYNGLQASMAGIIVGGIAVAALSKTMILRRQLKHLIQKVGEQNGAGSLGNYNGGDRTAT